jgi:hypothetical protein
MKVFKTPWGQRKMWLMESVQVQPLFPRNLLAWKICLTNNKQRDKQRLMSPAGCGRAQPGDRSIHSTHSLAFVLVYKSHFSCDRGGAKKLNPRAPNALLIAAIIYYIVHPIETQSHRSSSVFIRTRCWELLRSFSSRLVACVRTNKVWVLLADWIKRAAPLLALSS